MNNNQMYPFQRNRYYSGKLLTSADFQAEQDYFNNKQRFMNMMMYGPGIVCGLGVVTLDDFSILVESGAAIDGMGREIIQESSVVRKLSAVSGFDTLKTDEACLCIRYQEEQTHSIYAVNRENSDQEYEYSRISENSQLFLMDRQDAVGFGIPDTDFLAAGLLLRDVDYIAALRIPSTICRGRQVKMVLSVKKRTDRSSKLTMYGVLQLPGFRTAEGERELKIDVKDLMLKENETFEQEFWLSVPGGETDETMVILQSGTGHAYINDQAVKMNNSMELKVKVADADPREVIEHAIERRSFETRNLNAAPAYIRLADIDLVRTPGAYVIEKIDDFAAKHYIAAPAYSTLRARFMDYYALPAPALASADAAKTQPQQQSAAKGENSNLPEIASGTLEIPLGKTAHKGDIRYSGEIMHGLGPGNVYVQIGYESVGEDETLGRSARSTVYGDASLFRQNRTQAPLVETAVKVLNDKGSFFAAVKLLENVDYLMLTFRWVAFKVPSGNDIGVLQDYAGKNIVPETPTVVLETRESHFFGVRFENMDSCSLVYELTEPGSGEITADGIYTAPAKEGVYEIRIYCMDMPIICAYAYAIVKKKNVLEQQRPDET